MTELGNHTHLWDRLKALDKRGDEWLAQHSPRWLKLVRSTFKPKGFVHGIGLITLWLLAIAFIAFIACSIAAAREGMFFQFLHGFFTWLNDLRI